MTCIVGIVQDNKIYMGGDSAGVSDLDITIRRDPKVFRVGEFLLGFTSSFRMGQILMHDFDPPKIKENADPFRYMIKKFIPAVREAFKDGGYLEKNNEADQGGTFLVGIRGRLFVIEDDFQVGESHDGYLSVGCGSKYALGSLYETRHQPPMERIEKALNAAEHFSGGVAKPFITMEL